MKHARIYSLILLFAMLFSLLVVFPASAAGKITTTPTGYTSAEQVVYKKSGNYVANWGARGETATFLSTYAVSYYTGSYSFATLSQNAGGSSQGNAPSSALYSALKAMMTSKHTHQTSYAETKDQYKYTDCVSNGTANISSFYSGKVISGSWDNTWNREHTWPKSKSPDGNSENDIMMLRPTWIQENSSRGNDAYGIGSGYFDPGESTRGDCARIMLYVYTRWGITSTMWGQSGVIQSLDLLIEWMIEDPVDTWEMGRNDAVQSITGTRNVFVDYPEFAFMLFGRSIPEDYPTPSNADTSDIPVVTPPVDDPITYTSIPEILAIGATLGADQYTTEEYTVKGKITEIVSTQYGNLYIEDEEGNKLYIYGVNDTNGNRYDNMTDAPQVGDVVVLTGLIQNYESSKTGERTIELVNTRMIDKNPVEDPSGGNESGGDGNNNNNNSEGGNTATITYSLPLGLTATDPVTSTAVGSAITLPEATGTPKMAPDCSFAGWSRSEFDPRTTPIGLQKAGSKATISDNTVFYAVFTFQQNGKTYYTTDCLAPAPVSNEGAPISTGTVIIIAVAGVAVIGAGSAVTIVVVKKKKRI